MKTMLMVAAILFISTATRPLMAAGAAAAVSSGHSSQFAADWDRYHPNDRAACLRLIGPQGAYTDLLGCLKNKQEVRVRGAATVGQEAAVEQPEAEAF